METLVVRRKFINLGEKKKKKIKIFASNRLTKRNSTGMLLRQKRKAPRNSQKLRKEREQQNCLKCG